MNVRGSLKQAVGLVDGAVDYVRSRPNLEEYARSVKDFFAALEEPQTPFGTAFGWGWVDSLRRPPYTDVPGIQLANGYVDLSAWPHTTGPLSPPKEMKVSYAQLIAYHGDEQTTVWVFVPFCYSATHIYVAEMGQRWDGGGVVAWEDYLAERTENAFGHRPEPGQRAIERFWEPRKPAPTSRAVRALP